MSLINQKFPKKTFQKFSLRRLSLATAAVVSAGLQGCSHKTPSDLHYNCTGTDDDKAQLAGCWQGSNNKQDFWLNLNKDVTSGTEVFGPTGSIGPLGNPQKTTVSYDPKTYTLIFGGEKVTAKSEGDVHSCSDFENQGGTKMHKVECATQCNVDSIVGTWNGKWVDKKKDFTLQLNKSNGDCTMGDGAIGKRCSAILKQDGQSDTPMKWSYDPLQPDGGITLTYDDGSQSAVHLVTPTASSSTNDIQSCKNWYGQTGTMGPAISGVSWQLNSKK